VTVLNALSDTIVQKGLQILLLVSTVKDVMLEALSQKSVKQVCTAKSFQDLQE